MKRGNAIRKVERQATIFKARLHQELNQKHQYTGEIEFCSAYEADLGRVLQARTMKRLSFAKMSILSSVDRRDVLGKAVADLDHAVPNGTGTVRLGAIVG